MNRNSSHSSISHSSIRKWSHYDDRKSWFFNRKSRFFNRKWGHSSIGNEMESEDSSIENWWFCVTVAQIVRRVPHRALPEGLVRDFTLKIQLIYLNNDDSSIEHDDSSTEKWRFFDWKWDVFAGRSSIRIKGQVFYSKRRFSNGKMRIPPLKLMILGRPAGTWTWTRSTLWSLAWKSKDYHL